MKDMEGWNLAWTNAKTCSFRNFFQNLIIFCRFLNDAVIFRSSRDETYCSGRLRFGTKCTDGLSDKLTYRFCTQDQRRKLKKERCLREIRNERKQKNLFPYGKWELLFKQTFTSIAFLRKLQSKYSYS